MLERIFPGRKSQNTKTQGIFEIPISARYKDYVMGQFISPEQLPRSVDRQNLPPWMNLIPAQNAKPFIDSNSPKIPKKPGDFYADQVIDYT